MPFLACYQAETDDVSWLLGYPPDGDDIEDSVVLARRLELDLFENRETLTKYKNYALAT